MLATALVEFLATIACKMQTLLPGSVAAIRSNQGACDTVVLVDADQGYRYTGTSVGDPTTRKKILDIEEPVGSYQAYVYRYRLL